MSEKLKSLRKQYFDKKYKKPQIDKGGAYFMKVKSGDTLSQIAKDYGHSVSAIMKWNKGLIKDKDKLDIGWTLKIPQGPSIGGSAQVPFFKVGEKEKSVMPIKKQEVARTLRHRLSEKAELERRSKLRQQFEARLAQQKKDIPKVSIVAEVIKTLPKDFVLVMKKSGKELFKVFNYWNKLHQDVVISGLKRVLPSSAINILKRVQKGIEIDKEEMEKFMEMMRRVFK